MAAAEATSTNSTADKKKSRLEEEIEEDKPDLKDEEVKREEETTSTNSPDQKISRLEEVIEGYETEYKDATEREEKRELRRLITERSKYLRLLLRQSARDGEPFHCSTDVLEMRCC
jgi:hypothetical protein